MYKHCVTQSARQRQRELEEGLLQVMLHHDYENISVSDLCCSLDIPRKSFYRYFTNKDGALYALVDHALQDFAEELFSAGQTLDMDVAERFFAYWLTRRNLLHALERNNLGGLLVQRTIELTVSEKSYLPKILPEAVKFMEDYVLLFLVSGVMSLLIQWEKDHFKATPREMAVTAAHILNPAIFMK